VKPGGTFWFVFIGHGAASADGKDGVLVGVDATGDVDGLYARSIARNRILKLVDAGAQARAVVVFDSCFSGKSTSGSALVQGAMPLVPVRNEGLRRDRTVVFTAGRSDQFAGALPGVGRPAFSYLLLGALRGWGDEDGNGKVTSEEARRFASDTLDDVLTGRSQTPELWGDGEQVLASGRQLERAPDIGEILESLDRRPPARRDFAEEDDFDPGEMEQAVVSFSSTPQGAVVMVGDKVACQATPCSKAVPSGRHEVTMLKERHVLRGETVSLSNGQTVEWRLEEDFGRVRVIAPIEGVSIEVDGRAAGTTPLDVLELSPGRHDIAVTGRCWLAMAKGVDVHRGAETRVELEVKTRPSAIQVTAVDGDGNDLVGDVYVDGERVGRSPGRFKVGVCAERLEIKAKGFAPYTTTLSLRPKEVSELRGVLEAKKAGGEKRKSRRGRVKAPKGFVEIPAGTFTMGSPQSEPERGNDETQHEVTLSRSFWLQAREVTQSEYESLMGSNPSWFAECGGKCPVDSVTWVDAIKYANALSAKQGLPACYDDEGAVVGDPGGDPYGCVGYRLPTEAEWEYAARADTMQAQYGELDAIAWHSGNSLGQPHPVGGKAANAWGLHDMIGNVWEWTWDWYGFYPESAQVDGVGLEAGTSRLIRGGCWNPGARYLRAAHRNHDAPGVRNNNLGFRLARSIP
jgi:formylglycine-generating enzyme required for sulfatase activity